MMNLWRKMYPLLPYLINNPLQEKELELQTPHQLIENLYPLMILMPYPFMLKVLVIGTTI